MAAIAMSVATGFFFSTYVGLRIALGSCPAYDPIDGFDSDRYKGVWYEMQRDTSMTAETGECVTAEYGYTNYPARTSIENTQYYLDEGKEDKIKGYAYGSTFFPGKINVYFFGDFGLDYRVLATDYDNWAVIYSCSAYFGGLKV